MTKKSDRTLLAIHHGKYSRLLEKLKTLEKANLQCRNLRDIEDLAKKSHALSSVYMMLDDACGTIWCPEEVPCRDCPITILKKYIKEVMET